MGDLLERPFCVHGPARISRSTSSRQRGVLEHEAAAPRRRPRSARPALPGSARAARAAPAGPAVPRVAEAGQLPFDAIRVDRHRRDRLHVGVEHARGSDRDPAETPVPRRVRATTGLRRSRNAPAWPAPRPRPPRRPPRPKPQGRAPGGGQGEEPQHRLAVHPTPSSRHRDPGPEGVGEVDELGGRAGVQSQRVPHLDFDLDHSAPRPAIHPPRGAARTPPGWPPDPSRRSAARAAGTSASCLRFVNLMSIGRLTPVITSERAGSRNPREECSGRPAEHVREHDDPVAGVQLLERPGDLRPASLGVQVPLEGDRARLLGEGRLNRSRGRQELGGQPPVRDDQYSHHAGDYSRRGLEPQGSPPLTRRASSRALPSGLTVAIAVGQRGHPALARQVLRQAICKVDGPACSPPCSRTRRQGSSFARACRPAGELRPGHESS